MSAPWAASVVTLFPEMFPGPLGHSLAGRALQDGVWSLETINPRDFATDRHRSVDDLPFGGGAGMVMRPDVVARAIDAAAKAVAGALQAVSDAARHAAYPGARPAACRRPGNCGLMRPLRRGRSAGRRGESARRSQPRRHRAVGWRARRDRSDRRLRAVAARRGRQRRHRWTRRASPTSYWNTRSSPAHRSGRVGRCRTCCCPAITSASVPGAGARRSAPPDRGARISGRVMSVSITGPGRRNSRPGRTASEVAMNVIQELEQEQIAQLTDGRPIPEFAPGDTIRVSVKVVEGTRERVQAFEGVCIARKNRGINSRVHGTQDQLRRGRRARVSALQPADHRDRGDAPRPRAAGQAVLSARPDRQGGAHRRAPRRAAGQGRQACTERRAGRRRRRLRLPPRQRGCRAQAIAGCRADRAAVATLMEHEEACRWPRPCSTRSGTPTWCTRRTTAPALLYIDRHLVHEVTSPQAFEGLRQTGRKVRRADATLAVPDHNVPTTDRAQGHRRRDLAHPGRDPAAELPGLRHHRCSTSTTSARASSTSSAPSRASPCPA